jgi:hypothetical protein
MIGKTQLRLIARQVETLQGPLRCCGELVLAIQRALYGSETVCLSDEEQAEVRQFFRSRGANGGRLRAVPSPRRDAGF